jgi:hypothetical protein
LAMILNVPLVDVDQVVVGVSFVWWPGLRPSWWETQVTTVMEDGRVNRVVRKDIAW